MQAVSGADQDDSSGAATHRRASASRASFLPSPSAARYDGSMGNRLTIGLTVFALVAVPLGAYLGSYFSMSKRRDLYADGRGAFSPDERQGFELDHITRIYSREWQVKIFRPATRLETWIRSVAVTPISPESPGIPELLKLADEVTFDP